MKAGCLGYTLVLLMGTLATSTVHAAPVTFDVPLTVDQCTGAPVASAGKGVAKLTYDRETRVISWTVTLGGLSSDATLLHFHGPAKPGQNAPVAVWLVPKGTPPVSPVTGQATLTADQAAQLQEGNWYVNLHTQAFPACELRGHISLPSN